MANFAIIFFALDIPTEIVYYASHTPEFKGGETHLEFSNVIPIWMQIANRIRGEIVSGKIAPGEKLPGSRDLALKYSVNPNTAAHVYQELEKEGMCETRRGLGTFATADVSRIDAARQEAASRIIALCLQQLKALGYSDQEAHEMIIKGE